MLEPIAYVDGNFVPVSQAALHVFDLGVVTGATATEMVRTFRHQPFELAQHLQRLSGSLDGLGIESPLGRAEIGSIAERIVSHNAALIPASHDLGLTIFVTAGKNLTYIGAGASEADRRPTVCIHTFPLSFELWRGKLEAGQHLVTPQVRQIPAACLDPRIKCRSRAHWHVAEQQARRIAPGASALLLDLDGFVTETSTSNFFAVIQGTIITPPPTKTLGGVSQEVVRKLAGTLGIPYEIRDLRPGDVAAADEAFTSSTTSCMLSVTRYDNAAIGNGRPGPVFRRVLDAWSELAGLDIAAQIRGENVASHPGSPG